MLTITVNQSLYFRVKNYEILIFFASLLLYLLLLYLFKALIIPVMFVIYTYIYTPYNYLQPEFLNLYIFFLTIYVNSMFFFHKICKCSIFFLIKRKIKEKKH